MTVPGPGTIAWTNPSLAGSPVVTSSKIQENSTFLLEANSETTVRILGNGTIPPRAFFFVQLYILTETPSGNPYQASRVFSTRSNA